MMSTGIDYQSLAVMTVKDLKILADDLKVIYPSNAGEDAMLGLLFKHKAMKDKEEGVTSSKEDKEKTKSMESYLNPSFDFGPHQPDGYDNELLRAVVTANNPHDSVKKFYSTHIANNKKDYGAFILRFGITLGIPRIFAHHLMEARYTPILSEDKIRTDNISPEELRKEQPRFNLRFLKPLTNEQVIALLNRKTEVNG